MEKKHLLELEKSLKKCMCPLEKPLNAKHASIVVKKTYDLESAERLWTFALQQNLTVNRFATWKFLNLLHKVLHEGHPNVHRDSLKHLDKLIGCAQYWSHQKNHMGQCIAWYCKLLYTKLLFHQTYTCFKGNLLLEDDEPLWDINICFQLSLDIFDYLGDLLRLQRVIFANIAKHEFLAASEKGMCRLASLVTIIAECNLLYQHSTTILRILHLKLSPDDVSGLRERFNVFFEQLKLFYTYVRLKHLSDDYLPIVPQQVPIILPNLCSHNDNHHNQQQQQQQQDDEQP